MKIHSWVKLLLMFGCVLFMGNPVLYAQKDLVKQYLQETGDFAHIYSGELEVVYNPFFFENTPYFISQDYVDGEITYRGRHYQEQKIRLDLYKGNLILLTPNTRLGVVLTPQHVNEAHIHGRTIIYHAPPKNSGLKTGYYVQLHKGREFQLLWFPTVTVENVTDKVERRFTLNQRFFIVRHGVYYQVKNKRSFTRLFPEYKKQINRYAKENRLSFRSDRERSLVQLAQICEEMNH